jgi:hypothetical protein
MIDPRKHNYYEKLMKLVEESKVPPGQVTNVDICHDDWCGIYEGGYCNCEPEIKPWPRPEAS